MEESGEWEWKEHGEQEPAKTGSGGALEALAKKTIEGKTWRGICSIETKNQFKGLEEDQEDLDICELCGDGLIQPPGLEQIKPKKKCQE